MSLFTYHLTERGLIYPDKNISPHHSLPCTRINSPHNTYQQFSLCNSEMLTLLDSLLILVCISPLASGNSSCYRYANIRGFLLEAWVFGQDLQEPQDWMQRKGGGTRRDLDFSLHFCWCLDACGQSSHTPLAQPILPFLDMKETWIPGSLKMDLRKI